MGGAPDNGEGLHKIYKVYELRREMFSFFCKRKVHRSVDQCSNRYFQAKRTFSPGRPSESNTTAYKQI